MYKILSIDELEIKTPKELVELLFNNIDNYGGEDIDYIKDLIKCGAWIEFKEWDYTILNLAAVQNRSDLRNEVISLTNQ